MIFEEIFPGEAAERTVPGGKSIACSTERAMNWDAFGFGRLFAFAGLRLAWVVSGLILEIG